METVITNGKIKTACEKCNIYSPIKYCKFLNQVYCNACFQELYDLNYNDEATLLSKDVINVITAINEAPWQYIKRLVFLKDDFSHIIIEKDDGYSKNAILKNVLRTKCYKQNFKLIGNYNINLENFYDKPIKVLLRSL